MAMQAYLNAKRNETFPHLLSDAMAKQTELMNIKRDKFYIRNSHKLFTIISHAVPNQHIHSTNEFYYSFIESPHL